jgi:hypothetical protein
MIKKFKTIFEKIYTIIVRFLFKNFQKYVIYKVFQVI